MTRLEGCFMNLEDMFGLQSTDANGKAGNFVIYTKGLHAHFEIESNRSQIP